MRIYVIGPVTGHDDLNLPAFEEARRTLAESGYTPLIPHDFIAPTADWQQAMRRSVETLTRADGVACLPGWSKSNGARREVETAQWLGIPTLDVDEWADQLASSAVMIDAKTTKLCPHCKRVIPLTLFNRSSNVFDGRQTYCRDCLNGYKHRRNANGVD